MSHSPLVSVVIPTYNRAPLLRRALASVQVQTFRDWEAIVIDDYSDDDTDAVIASFGDPRIRMVKFKSSGVIAAARNQGIRLARGTIVAFLDSDDAWYPLKLARCLDALMPDVDLVGHGLLYIRGGQHWKRVRSGPAQRATYESLLYNGNCLTTSAVVVRKEWLDRVSGFIEDRVELVRAFKAGRLSKGGAPVHVGAEDYDLWVRLARAGARFAFVDEILGEYHIHSQSSGKSALSLIDSQLAVVARHFSDPPQSVREMLRRRRRQALVYYGIARSLQDDGDHRGAVRLFWEAFRRFPFIPKLVMASAAAVGLAATEILIGIIRAAANSRKTPSPEG